MTLRESKAKYETSMFLQSVEIPMNVFVERRRSVRVSFGKGKVNIRIPNQLDIQQQQIQFGKAKEWVEEAVANDSGLLEQFRIKTYDGSFITVCGKEHSISVNRGQVKSGRIELKGSEFRLMLPLNMTRLQEVDMIKKLLSRMSAKIYHNQIINEVRSINTEHFKKDINRIRLKYNKSNWGSCSMKKNINLSTRLLLVPLEVREYVIVHELSHLIEMNHSKQFWSIVEKACPGYREHEQWLKLKGSRIDY